MPQGGYVLCCGAPPVDEEEPSTLQRRVRTAWSYCSLLLDTMPKWGDALDNFYKNEDSSRMMKLLALFLILMDSVFRGVGQALLCNNPISGIFILIGVAMASRWQLAMGFLGALLSTTMMVLGLKRARLRAGLYGYCGFLLGMALALFTPTWNWKTVILVVVGASITTFMTMSITEWTSKHSLPALTTAFVLATTMVILLIRVSPNLDQEILVLGFPHIFKDPTTVQITTAARNAYRGAFAGIAQTCLVGKPQSGILMLIGVLFFSRVAAVVGFISALFGYLLAVLLGIDPSVSISGLWGYNPCLTAIAVCGLFYKFNLKSALIASYAVLLSCLMNAALTPIVALIGAPILTTPFIVCTWFALALNGSIANLEEQEMGAGTLEDENRWRKPKKDRSTSPNGRSRPPLLRQAESFLNFGSISK